MNRPWVSIGVTLIGALLLAYSVNSQQWFVGVEPRSGVDTTMGLSSFEVCRPAPESGCMTMRYDSALLQSGSGVYVRRWLSVAKVVFWWGALGALTLLALVGATIAGVRAAALRKAWPLVLGCVGGAFATVMLTVMAQNSGLKADMSKGAGRQANQGGYLLAIVGCALLARWQRRRGEAPAVTRVEPAVVVAAVDASVERRRVGPRAPISLEPEEPVAAPAPVAAVAAPAAHVGGGAPACSRCGSPPRAIRGRMWCDFCADFASGSPAA